MKSFEAYKSTMKNDLHTGDRVVVIYPYSDDYLKIGTIISMVTGGPNSGDCFVLMDYSNQSVPYFYTNLRKVFELVEFPSGEVVYIYYNDLIELNGTGVLKYNNSNQIYFYKEEDRWQIERFMI